MLDDGQAKTGLALAFEPQPNPRPRPALATSHTRVQDLPLAPTLAGALAHTEASLALSASSFATHAAAASSSCERW